MAATGSKRGLSLSRKRKTKELNKIISEAEAFPDVKSKEKKMNLEESFSLDQKMNYMPSLSDSDNHYADDVSRTTHCVKTDSRVDNTILLPSVSPPSTADEHEETRCSGVADCKNCSGTSLTHSGIILTPLRSEYIAASLSVAQGVLKHNLSSQKDQKKSAISSQTTLDSYFTSVCMHTKTSQSPANTHWTVPHQSNSTGHPDPPPTLIDQSLPVNDTVVQNLLQQNSKIQQNYSRMQPLHSNSKASFSRSKPLSKSDKVGNMGVNSSDAVVCRSSYQKRSCPTYKWIPGTGFIVDAFCYGSIPNCHGYFLSHFHSDHYIGLTKHFKHTLYCSKITSNLVCQQLKVSPLYVHHLPMNEPVVINGVTVILLEANHCPGSVMFLFRLSNGKVFLHTGDFRATPSMKQLEVLKGLNVNTLFLDTTYCDPRYDFPPQDSVIQFVVDTTLDYLIKHPRSLIVCGSYTIGKEKIFQGIAAVLNCKVYVNKEKKKIIDCLESQSLSEMCVCREPASTKLHVVSINRMNPQDLLSYLSMFSEQFDSLLAFKPTGWTFRNNSVSLGNIRPRKYNKLTLYGVPYSEHSSFSELKDFVTFFKPGHVVSTVGGIQARSKAESHCHHWLNEKSELTFRKPKQTTLDTMYKVK